MHGLRSLLQSQTFLRSPEGGGSPSPASPGAAPSGGSNSGGGSSSASPPGGTSTGNSGSAAGSSSPRAGEISGGTSPSPPTPGPAAAPSGTPSPGAPASQPTSQPTEAGEPGGDPFDFAAIFGDDTGVPQPQTPAPPQQTTQEAPPPADPNTGQPQATPPVQTQPQTGQEPGPQAQRIDAGDPASLLSAINASRADYEEAVANSLFALSDADKKALEEDTIGFIPKLMARAFVHQQTNILAHLTRMIPNSISRFQTLTNANNETRDKFYSAWPDIDREKHDKDVVKAVSMYRKTFPDANFDQMSTDLGPLLTAKFRKATPASGQQPQGRSVGNGNQPQAPGRPVSFVPALGGPAIVPHSDPEAVDYSWLDPNRQE